VTAIVGILLKCRDLRGGSPQRLGAVGGEDRPHLVIQQRLQHSAPPLSTANFSMSNY
jgi:hypothetical protein